MKGLVDMIIGDFYDTKKSFLHPVSIIGTFRKFRGAVFLAEDERRRTRYTII